MIKATMLNIPYVAKTQEQHWNTDIQKYQYAPSDQLDADETIL